MDFPVRTKLGQILDWLGTNVTNLSVYFPVWILDLQMYKEVWLLRKTLSACFALVLLSCLKKAVTLQLSSSVEALTDDFTSESVVFNVSSFMNIQRSLVYSCSFACHIHTFYPKNDVSCGFKFKFPFVIFLTNITFIGMRNHALFQQVEFRKCASTNLARESSGVAMCFYM
jgi:hypothetical protein